MFAMEDNKIKTIELVSALKNGNEEAYNELYKMYYDQMFRIAMMNIETSGNKNIQTAEDIVQESMIKAYQKIDTLKDNSNFAGWLCMIVKNKCRDYFDKAYVKHESLLIDEEKTDDEGKKAKIEELKEDKRDIFKPDVLLDEDTKNEMLHEILNSLNEEQKVVTIMYYFDDFSKQEIADTLGIKVTTVDGRLSTARKNIEKGVLSLEKKEGIKLYNISAIPAIPFFLYLLGKAQISEDAINKTVLSTAAKHITEESTKKDSIKSADTFSKATKKTSVPISKKVIAGLIAGTCVIGGGVAISNVTATKTFDAFSIINEVKFEGISGKGTASVVCENDTCSYNGGNVYFTFDNNRLLSNGDTVTLTVEIGDEKEFAKEHGGYIPEETSKTYTVENLYEYISTVEDIPDETLDYYKKQIETVCNERIEQLNYIHDTQNTNILYSNFEYVGDFVMTPNFDTADWHNNFYLVYKINIQGENINIYSEGYGDNVSASCYILFSFDDLAVNSDGYSQVTLYSDETDISSRALSKFNDTFGSTFICLHNMGMGTGYESIEDIKSYFSGGSNNYSWNLN
jgi:RNA polymerase sigma-70 factor, ECF subfamily